MGVAEMGMAGMWQADAGQADVGRADMRQKPMTAMRLPACFAVLRPSVPAAASLLVNGVLLAILLTMGAGRRERALDQHPLSIMSLAALKGSEQGEDHALAAEPAAAPAPAQREAVQSPAQPVAHVVPPPMLPPPMLPQPSQAAPTMASPVSVAAPPSSGASPAASSPGAKPAVAAPGRQGAMAPRRGIAEGLDADAPAGKSIAYAAKIRSWLYAHKVYPRRARMRREEGVVRVRFVIDRAGVLLEGMIVRSSGKSSLDEEATAMMHRASPFPSAPAAIMGERIEFTAPIEFMLPV